MDIRQFFIALAFLNVYLPAYSQVRPAAIFSDNMVVQREKPIKIWGKSIPGKMIHVRFADLTADVTTKMDSSWVVTFPAQKATSKPVQLIISTDTQQFSYGNILIGDVWLCIGQSNMEWPMSKEVHYRDEIKNPIHDNLRFYNPDYAGKNVFGTPFSDSITKSLNSHDFIKGHWETSDSASVSRMSAVAYYFGINIMKAGVPIGLIHYGIGGAPLETFIDAEAMAHHKVFYKKVDGNWLVNNQLPVWIRQRALENVGNNLLTPVDKIGKNHPFKPGFAFKSGILPLKNLRITGIICYQGESNAQEKDRVAEYGNLFALMVNGYRKLWNDYKLPIYFAQISSIDTLHYKGQLWPEFRNEQRIAASKIPFSYMAVTSDYGEKHDVHPRNKKVVGERLSLLALKYSYKFSILDPSPQPLDALYKNGQVIIRFKKGTKLISYPENYTLHGFQFEDGIEKQAVIHQNEIKIKSAIKPNFVTYGWHPYALGNLYNEALLPVSTFKLFLKNK